MRILKTYIIKRDTIAIIPMYDKNGNLYSSVIQRNEVITVNMRPLKIIELSLLHYGSSVHGANSGAKYVLGNVKMTPIRISAELEIYWFPCSSPVNQDCVWLSQAHIVDSFPMGEDQTIVYLAAGHSVIVDKKRERFIEKLERATMLRFIQSERNKRGDAEVYEPLSGYQIWKNHNNHYDITGPQSVDESEDTYN